MVVDRATSIGFFSTTKCARNTPPTGTSTDPSSTISSANCVSHPEEIKPSAVPIKPIVHTDPAPVDRGASVRHASDDR